MNSTKVVASRNKREGRYYGHSYGKAYRGHGMYLKKWRKFLKAIK